jgi:hypothetical protein
MNAELHVLHVVPPIPNPSALYPDYCVVGPEPVAHLHLEALQITRKWVEAISASAASRIIIRSGAFSEVTAEVVLELRAALVVVGEHTAATAKDVTGLWTTRSSRYSLTRTRGAAGVLAATDLMSPELPVIESSWRLSRNLESPLAFVHNIPPSVQKQREKEGNTTIRRYSRRTCQSTAQHRDTGRAHRGIRGERKRTPKTPLFPRQSNTTRMSSLSAPSFLAHAPWVVTPNMSSTRPTEAILVVPQKPPPRTRIAWMGIARVIRTIPSDFRNCLIRC